MESSLRQPIAGRVVVTLLLLVEIDDTESWSNTDSTISKANQPLA